MSHAGDSVATTDFLPQPSGNTPHTSRSVTQDMPLWAATLQQMKEGSFSPFTHCATQYGRFMFERITPGGNVVYAARITVPNYKVDYAGLRYHTIVDVKMIAWVELPPTVTAGNWWFKALDECKPVGEASSSPNSASNKNKLVYYSNSGNSSNGVKLTVTNYNLPEHLLPYARWHVEHMYVTKESEAVQPLVVEK